MSFPTTNPLPPDASIAVFVDESGRRRARTRIVARALVAAAGVYVLIVFVGLTGSVDLPGVHLGELERSAPGRAQTSALGPGSKIVSLPGALKARSGAADAAPSATSPGNSGVAPGAAGPSAGGSDGAAPGAGSTPTTGPGNAPTTTTSAGSTTTLPVTTTTRLHGPPTSTARGPSTTTKPGQGKGRTQV